MVDWVMVAACDGNAASRTKAVEATRAFERFSKTGSGQFAFCNACADSSALLNSTYAVAFLRMHHAKTSRRRFMRRL